MEEEKEFDGAAWMGLVCCNEEIVVQLARETIFYAD
jgi:hypothetical protein